MKTLVFGASEKVDRYSNIAIKRLVQNDHLVEAVGYREGMVDQIKIQKGTPKLEDIDTITLYLNAKRQVPFYDYFFSLKPRRIIFNPGTENPELFDLAKAKGIEVENACTLVQLSRGVY